MENKVGRNGILKTDSNYFTKRKTNECITRTFGNLHTWYTNQKYGALMLIVFFVIDLAGFYQIISNTLYETKLIRAVIVSGFGAAFEIAPLYIGYSACLIYYNWAIERFNKLILSLSIAAFGLGVVANTVYRVLTMTTAYSDNIEPRTALATTITMCILPVITSLINLVIGCLAFDPLYIHLIKLSKQISVLKTKERQLKACLKEYELDEKCKDGYRDEVDTDFENIKIQIEAMKDELKRYVEVRCIEDD